MENRVITGFRPTSDLTVGNYLGAIKPSLELQGKTEKLYAFIADLHGLTDSDPRDIAPYRFSVAKDCMAFGIDPSQSTLYMQSDIEAPTVQIANRLAPYVKVGRLASTPNLKERLDDAMKRGEVDGEEASKANFALLGYPVLMAADIFAQQSYLVAVGEDQKPHLEIARDMARSFNNTFESNILVEPRIVGLTSLRILSLDGKGKMSKTNPNQAILMTDDPEQARQKIKRAVTVGSGEWNEAIESHFTVAEATAQTPEQKQRLRELKAAHEAGQSVMSQFKDLWGDITEQMLDEFQTARDALSDEEVRDALRFGADKAEQNATETLSAMKEVMGF